MSFRIPSQHDRKNVIAMEDFCELMETPLLFQLNQGVYNHQPHLNSLCNSSSGESQTLPQLLFIDNIATSSHYIAGLQPHLSTSKAYGSHAYNTGLELHPDKESQFALGNTLGRSQRLPETCYSKVQECNLMRRDEKPKPYNIHEKSIDKDAGDFIRMRHNKFNLSK